MAFAVYDPPEAGLPYLAVVLCDEELIVVEPVSSAEEAEQLIHDLSEELAKKADDRRTPAKHSDRGPSQWRR